MTGCADATAAAAVEVNGPEGDLPDWDQVDWGQAEENVRRLRQRIFAASQAGDLNKVRNLQKLMLRSRSNALVSVRRVAEINAGRKTAGVDGRIVLAGWEKADLAAWLQRGAAAWRPLPVKRVYVPKSNGRRRGLGIPVIADRGLQALAVNALEPEWEARSEPKSCGFRPGRGCHDAIVAIHTIASGKLAKRLWALDADLQAAFDRLSHDHILASLGTFPARGLVRRWMRAGVIEDGALTPASEGVPQGGVVSPLLMNVALHGMEEAAGTRYYRNGDAVPGCPIVVRCADDLIALCHSRDQAEQVQARLARWLEPGGLVFNQDKTRITHLDQGVDFLGFEIRRFSGKLLTKPGRDALRQIRRRLSTEVKALRGANADAVIARLNPVITGSPGVLSLSHDVAPERSAESFCTTSRGCGAHCCRCSGGWPARTCHMHDNPPGRRRVDDVAATCRIRSYARFAPVFTPENRGWAAYYRTVVSTRTFNALDDYMWKLTYKWATWRHADKPKRWIVGRYFGKFNKFRNDHWVFGDRDSGVCLVKFSWTGIVRHVPVKGAASPDDPALAAYWAERRERVKPPLDRYTLRLLARQDGHCPLCGDHLLTADQPPQFPEQWERWWLQVTRQAIAASYLAHHGRPGSPDGNQTRLVHASCQRGLRARRSGKPALQLQPARPSRLA